jgi:phytoene dehydrogenase-like protein
MLEGRYVSDEIRRRHEDWPLVRPLLTASFGVAREFKDDPPFGISFFAAPIALGEERIPGMWIRIFNYSGKFAPPEKTVVQATVETSWDYWNDLRREKARYDAEKERLASEILARLEVVYPGISAQVEVTDVTTPYTTWRYTLNRRGAYEGWIPTPKAIMSKPIRTLPGLASFYMAGQWVVPGGGVPPCLYSGRHVIQILRRRSGKPFLTSAP